MAFTLTDSFVDKAHLGSPEMGPNLPLEWMVKNVLFWVILTDHFRGDWVVPSAGADEMCRQINTRGGSAKQTKFDGIGHDCWDRAVAESNVVNWMLAQRVSARVDNATHPEFADVR